MSLSQPSSFHRVTIPMPQALGAGGDVLNWLLFTKKVKLFNRQPLDVATYCDVSGIVTTSHHFFFLFLVFQDAKIGRMKKRSKSMTQYTTIISFHSSFLEKLYTIKSGNCQVFFSFFFFLDRTAQNWTNSMIYNNLPILLHDPSLVHSCYSLSGEVRALVQPDVETLCCGVSFRLLFLSKQRLAGCRKLREQKCASALFPSVSILSGNS